MAHSRTVGVWVVDGGRSMSECIQTSDPNSNGYNRFDLALSTVISCNVQKSTISKTYESSLFLYGQGVTKNDFQDSYEDVEEKVPISKPDISVLRDLLALKAGPTESPSLVDALVVATAKLAQFEEGKAINRIMTLITDGSTPLGDEQDHEDLEATCSHMIEKHCILNIIMIGDANEIASDTTKSENCKLYSGMALALKGKFQIVSDLGNAISFVNGLAGFAPKIMKSKITMEITPTLKLHCNSYKRVTEKSIPSLKKEAVTTYDPSDPDSGTVYVDNSHRTTDADNQVEFNEIAVGYKYGADHIPVSDADKSALTLDVDTSNITTLGFIHARQIPRHHFLESPVVIEGATTASAKAIAAIAMAMANEGQVLVARYMRNIDPDKYRSDVQLVVLIAPPQDDGTLLLHRIPCLEDFRNFPFPHMTSIDKILPCQKDAVSEYIRCMTVPYESTNDDSLLGYDAPLLSVLHAAQRRALSNAKLYQLNEPIQPRRNLESAKNAIQKLRESFPMEYIEQKGTKKRKMYWADDVVIRTDDKDDSTTMQEASSSSATSSSSSLEITVQNPVEDFEKIVQNCPDDGESLMSAFKRMTEVIDELVTQAGGNNAYFRKAIASLKSLRTNIVSKKDVCTESHNIYNAFLKDSVKHYKQDPKNAVFWDNFFSKKGSELTLISTGEIPASMTSFEEAQSFITEDAQGTISSDPVNQLDDSMLNDLE